MNNKIGIYKIIDNTFSNLDSVVEHKDILEFLFIPFLDQFISGLDQINQIINFVFGFFAFLIINQTYEFEDLQVLIKAMFSSIFYDTSSNSKVILKIR